MESIRSGQLVDDPVIKKSEKISIICCIIGEKALSDDENNEALKAFTTALRLAPVTSKMIAHCYFWRSVALQKLRAFTECLQDIKRALKLQITEKQKTYLLNKKKVIQGLLLKESNKNVKIDQNENSQEELTLSYGENAEIPGVSSAMTLVYEKEFGRHYIATRDIKIGDVLMIQKPLFFVLNVKGIENSKETGWICDCCLNSTLAPIPCDKCTLPLYCSFKCRSESYEKFHRTECKIVNVSPPTGRPSAMFLRALLILTNQGERFQEAVNLMEEVQNCKDKRTVGFKDGKLDGKSINAFLSLLHHMDKQESPDLLIYAKKVVAVLKNHTDFLKGSNDVYNLEKLFIFISFICKMNVYGIRRSGISDIVAFGLYPVYNLLNHSCVCNTIIYDDKEKKKILRACKNIQKGEQIFVSYRSFDVINLKAAERKKIFFETKFFTCRCDACERDYCFQPELTNALKVPASLKRKFLENPNDTESLWELLKIMLKEYKGPCYEAKAIELALVNAYMGADNTYVFKVLKQLRLI